MKQSAIILSAILLAFFSTSCIFSPSIKGNGNVVQEIRNVGDFDEIKVSRGMNVYISQGEPTKITVKADENLLEVIETDTNGGVLEITTKSTIRNATEKKVYITTPNLVMLKSFAGSNIYSETTINTDELEISASAGSNISLDINTKKLVVSANAGSNISLYGEAKSFEGKVSSGSNIKATKLTTQNGKAKASSGANIWLTTENSLNAHASSGGNIFYYGKPENTEIEKSSGGNVINKN
ncbi:DUF2807 domain-containing protein [Prolixibacteraceae bacterium Z1-6]|uniref:DUF2807 domain-containing protein n=1 Tax=Draconibacterium aestuarii TaxID=2998507 RepID=A0A9X3F5Q3_9BACT|nr:DUF2807 domain-containing protein [Prolixibacteraceae bacterium Z1-6]